MSRIQQVLLLAMLAAGAAALLLWRRRHPSSPPMQPQEPLRSIIDKSGLPIAFPTHRHEAVFWESLGRTVATFGFLEDTLARAIFALTGTRTYTESEIAEAFLKWLPTLERAISDPLGKQIGTFEKSVKAHPEATITNLDELVSDLRKAAELRNVLCHGSWPPPDSAGRSVPFYVDTKQRIFDTAVDIQFLEQVRVHAAELACEVVNVVTHMGYRFPGSNGPGKPVWP